MAKEEEQGAAGRRTRRRFSPEQKIALLDEADRPGESIATVARRHGVSESQLFRWRRLREEGGVAGVETDADLVPAAELKAAHAKIRELQRLLGKKTEEVEILQEAVKLTQEKKPIWRSSSRRRRGGP